MAPYEPNSIHKDKDGNIIHEYDDGDNGIYEHENGTTKEDIDAQRNKGANPGGDGNFVGDLGYDYIHGTLTKLRDEALAKQKLNGILTFLDRVIRGDAWVITGKVNIFILGGVTFAPIGAAVMRHGPESGKLIVLSDYGIGLGFDVSATVNVEEKRYFTLNTNNIQSKYLSGFRGEFNLKVGEGLVSGVGVSANLPINVPFILGTSVSGGIGCEVPPGIGFNANVGYTKFWK
jgi:hypothetical protein